MSKKTIAKHRRARRVRLALCGSAKHRVRLSVHKSSRHIYAQIIDDRQHITLAHASTLIMDAQKDKKMSPCEAAFHVGEIIGKKAMDANVGPVVFDRGSSRYHGRIKAVAEGARKAGLIF